MNNQRRKAIADVVERLAALSELVDEIKSDVETIRDEEQEALDSIEEHFPESERAERANAAVDALEEAAGNLEMIEVDDIVANLEGASE